MLRPRQGQREVGLSPPMAGATPSSGIPPRPHVNLQACRLLYLWTPHCSIPILKRTSASTKASWTPGPMCMLEFGHLNPGTCQFTRIWAFSSWTSPTLLCVEITRMVATKSIRFIPRLRGGICGQHQGHQEKPDPAGSVCSTSVFTAMIASTKATKQTRSNTISLLHISLHRNDCMHQGHPENQIQQDQFAPHQSSQQWLHPPRPPRKPDPAGSFCSTSVFTAMIASTKATKKTRSSRIILLHISLHRNDCMHQGHQENQIQQDLFAPHQSTPQWLHAPRPPRKPDPAGSVCSTSVYTAMIACTKATKKTRSSRISLLHISLHASTKATKKTRSSRIILLHISLHRNDCMHQGHQENQIQQDHFAPHQSSQQWLHPPRPPRKPDPAGSFCSTSVYTAMIACTKATKKTRSSRIS